jgi:hypothetical protein
MSYICGAPCKAGNFNVYIYIYIYIYIRVRVCVCVCVDLRLSTLKAVSFYLLHNVATLNKCRKLSCVTNYQAYPNYKWDLIR